MRAALALIPFAMLAGCGGGDSGNSATPVTSSTPVAQATPPAGKAWADVVSKSQAGGYVQGNPNAPIKLVEYGSRTCPTCGRFAEEGVPALRQKYIATGQVSYEFRDFPIHGAPDVALSLLNQCAGTEAFFPMLDQMFANQQGFFERQQKLPEAVVQQLGSMSPPQAAALMGEQLGIIDFVKQRGVPEAKARQCLADQTTIKQIADALAEGTNRGVQGTPNFFINDQQIEGATWSGVETALKAAGAR